jgi:hypothetical protein
MGRFCLYGSPSLLESCPVLGSYFGLSTDFTVGHFSSHAQIEPVGALLTTRTLDLYGREGVSVSAGRGSRPLVLSVRVPFPA